MEQTEEQKWYERTRGAQNCYLESRTIKGREYPLNLTYLKTEKDTFSRSKDEKWHFEYLFDKKETIEHNRWIKGVKIDTKHLSKIEISIKGLEGPSMFAQSGYHLLEEIDCDTLQAYEYLFKVDDNIPSYILNVGLPVQIAGDPRTYQREEIWNSFSPSGDIIRGEPKIVKVVVDVSTVRIRLVYKEYPSEAPTIEYGIYEDTSTVRIRLAYPYEAPANKYEIYEDENKSKKSIEFEVESLCSFKKSEEISMSQLCNMIIMKKDTKADTEFLRLYIDDEKYSNGVELTVDLGNGYYVYALKEYINTSRVDKICIDNDYSKVFFKKVNYMRITDRIQAHLCYS